MGKRAIPSETRAAISRLLETGMSFRGISEKIGVHRHTVSRQARTLGYGGKHGRHGGVSTVFMPLGLSSVMAPDGHGRRLGMFERAVIQIKHAEGFSHARIAQLIGCAASTVTRELLRNRGNDGLYLAPRAQSVTEVRRLRPRQRRLDRDLELRGRVLECLTNRFSPQQTAAHLRERFPDREEMHVSHETIYQALYVQGRGSLRQELAREKALRSGRTARIPRSRFPKGLKKTWVEGCAISARPPEVEDRSVPGHWEGDLVVGARNQSAIITLVERSTRFVLLRRLPERHDTDSVVPLLVQMIQSLPVAMRKSLTWDQGPEMSSHKMLTVATDMKVFFCDPHSPWQRGSNENTNGLVRDFFPKGTDFHAVTDEEILDAERLLNMRPRQTLGWATPAHAFLQATTGSALTT